VYPFCAAIFGFFDGACESCDGARLRRCIAENTLPDPDPFVGVRAEHWEALRKQFVARVLDFDVKLVSPTRAAANRWKTLMPSLAGQRFAVIPHGVALPLEKIPEPPAGGKLRVAILGRLAPHKGLTLLEHAVASLADRIEFFLLGCGDSSAQFEGVAGVRVVREYRHRELPKLLAEVRPHLGLVASTVPETFSYTLSEFMHFGIPPLVTNIGSLSERVEEGVNGFQSAPTPQAFASKLASLDADRASIGRVRAALTGCGARTAADMVHDYHALTPNPPLCRPGLSSVSKAVEERTVSLADEAWLDPHFAFRSGAAAFHRFFLAKLESTPRLSTWQKRALLSILARRARR
jgi:glycosyltransferase involved in cell wall biosynthesis